MVFVEKLSFDRPFLLELGAGKNPKEGYTHQDIRDNLPHIEIVCPAEYIYKYIETPIDSLRACHILEHFSYLDTIKILEMWFNCMAPGGEIHIEVPHLNYFTKAHTLGELTDEEVVNYLYGDQDYDYNFHMAAFSVPLLRKRLQEAGFEDVVVQDIGMVLIGNGYKPELAEIGEEEF